MNKNETTINSAMEIARLILSWKLGRDDVLDHLDISDEAADALLEEIEKYMGEEKMDSESLAYMNK